MIHQLKFERNKKTRVTWSFTALADLSPDEV